MNQYVRFISVLILSGVTLTYFGYLAKRGAENGLQAAAEEGEPAGIVMKVKDLSGDGVVLVYTSKMMIFAVPAGRYESIKGSIVGYRVTAVPRPGGEVDLLFEKQQVLVPAYLWHE